MKINMPFPPQLQASDIIHKKRNSQKLVKPQNGFIIYRGQYLRELQKQGFKPGMTEISKVIGSVWKNEPAHVKKWYDEFSQEARKLLIIEQIKSISSNKQNWIQWNSMNKFENNNRKKTKLPTIRSHYSESNTRSEQFNFHTQLEQNVETCYQEPHHFSTLKKEFPLSFRTQYKVEDVFIHPTNQSQRAFNPFY
ncbi:hypothetical protein G9A89_003268 [Geosiphon pyriformis]|nr:hypothetical protein G9A89_003268 [Geosiphon pyriformis]